MIRDGTETKISSYRLVWTQDFQTTAINLMTKQTTFASKQSKIDDDVTLTVNGLGEQILHENCNSQKHFLCWTPDSNSDDARNYVIA